MIDKVAFARGKVASGLSAKEMVAVLHGMNFTIVESMKFIVEEYGVTLREAKLLVTNDSVWDDVIESAKCFHDEAISSLSEKQ